MGKYTGANKTMNGLITCVARLTLCGVFPLKPIKAPTPAKLKALTKYAMSRYGIRASASVSRNKEPMTKTVNDDGRENRIPSNDNAKINLNLLIGRVE